MNDPQLATRGESVGREKASRPAWLMSMVLHAVVFLVLVFTVRSRIVPPGQEPDRPASIVLVSRSDMAGPEYFASAEQHDAATDRTKSAAQTAESTTDLSGDPLPPEAAAAALLLDVNLPGPTDGAAASGLDGQSLLPVPQLNASGRPRILPGLGDEDILANDPLRNRPPGGPKGPTAKMTLFGHVAEGRSFVFLIDRSKSMGGSGLGAIAAAERELVRELANLAPVHAFQIIAYNQSYTAISRKGLVEAAPENKELARRFLAGVVAAGSTEHEPALTAALRMKPEVIFLLTDGGDPPLSNPEIDLLTRENGGHAIIHCLHFGSGPLQEPDNFLARLARLNRGSYTYIDMQNAPVR